MARRPGTTPRWVAAAVSAWLAGQGQFDEVSAAPWDPGAEAHVKQQVTFEYEGQPYTVEVERHGDTLVIESEGHSYEVTLTGAVRARATPAPAGGAAPSAGPRTGSGGPGRKCRPGGRRARAGPPQLPPAAPHRATWWRP